MKGVSTFTFGDKMWGGVHVLSQITVKKRRNMFLKNDKSLPKTDTQNFLVPSGAMYSECTLYFIILFTFMISKVRYIIKPNTNCKMIQFVFIC